ncbi:RNA recognition motif domain [Macleaya cordata]|uniref:RNA recognition motif domain n=1 Tax=Macleaya cordata TaxID=56857 RepID=A0A200R6H8_MACCD|nr:RNA recognition motif domain [Macleaya cordata]
MVLSNKKLKQKLRSAIAESLATSVAGDAPKESTKENANSEVQSLKELLDSATHKPRLSKREKRRKDLPLKKTTPEGNNDDTQKENKEISGSEDLNGKKKKNKKKKRKREEVEGQEKENGVSEPAEKKPAKKKKKKAKKQKKNKKNDKVVENNGEHIEEPVMIDESQENVDIATKVYVGGIPYYSTEDDIRSFFESCGTITEIDCMRFPETGKFRGIAMITFKTEAAAKRALALDGADMGGLFLKIQPYKTTSRPQKSSSDFAPKIVEGYNRVYVGNLSWDITEDDLRNLFSDCKISSIRFGMDKETEEFRGYAHVDFADSLSLTIALKLDQKEVCGRPAKISCAVPKKEVKTGSKSSEPRSKKVEKEVKTGSKESEPRSKKIENDSTSKVESDSSCKVENDSSSTVPVSASSGGKKRRTCYECGVPGHISSDCPKKKQAVDPLNSS